MTAGSKHCPQCGAVFRTKSKRKKFCTRDCTNKFWRRKIYQENREKIRRQDKEHYQKNKDAHKNSSLRALYGITLDDYNRLFKEQKGSCKICGRHQTEFKKRLHVDHCHTTGKIRGLLCQKCNHAIGLIDDDPQRATLIAEYLS